MLPPVRAALSSTTDYQSQTQTAINRARVDISPGSPPALLGGSAALSGARSDAVSLSAQLKLAQGSSILAETIGKLLKTPRRENETLIDYTTRLFDAMRALKPQDVANVERLLNQIVKGISLQLMAEILKEPSGPAAARLAAHIETANPAQRDLATKTVVSFYRQNASSDLPQNANTPRLVQTGGPTVTTSNQATQAATAVTDDYLPTVSQAAKSPAPLTAEGQGVRSAGSSPPAPASLPMAADPKQQEHAPRSTPAAAQAGTVASQAASGQPTTGGTAGPSGTATAPAAPQNAAQSRSEPAGQIVVKAGPGNSVIGNQSPAVTGQPALPTPETELQDTRFSARSTIETFKQAMPVPPLLWSSLPQETLLKLASWLASVLSELDKPETAHPFANPAAGQTTSDDRLGEQPRANAGQSAMSPASTSSPAGAAATSQQAALAEVAENVRTAGVPAARGEIAEHQMAILSAAVSTQTRETLPWPYVAAYPPAEEEPRREQRKTHPIEAIEDEEPDGSSQQQSFDGEQQGSDAEQDEAQGEESAVDMMTKAEKAAGYTAAEAKVEAETVEARPSDFYWRMAGWT